MVEPACLFTPVRSTLDSHHHIISDSPDFSPSMTNSGHLELNDTESRTSAEKLSATLLNISSIPMDEQVSPFIPRSKGRKSYTVEDYSRCYGNAENFLDTIGFDIVEPGAENKIRKYVRVVVPSRPMSMASTESSPLYQGSPSLGNISESSLISRRVKSNNQTPRSQNDSPVDNKSMSFSALQVVIKTSPIPTIISKFGNDSRKNSLDMACFEGDHQVRFHLDDPNEFVKVRSNEYLSGLIAEDSTIDEVTEPSTPCFDLISKMNQIESPNKAYNGSIVTPQKNIENFIKILW